MLVIGIAVGVCWVVDGVDDDGAVVVDGSEGSFACRVVGGGPADDGGGGGGRCEGVQWGEGGIAPEAVGEEDFSPVVDPVGVEAVEIPAVPVVSGGVMAGRILT